LSLMQSPPLVVRRRTVSITRRSVLRTQRALAAGSLPRTSRRPDRSATRRALARSLSGHGRTAASRGPKAAVAAAAHAGRSAARA
jgi:hypothetical protein